jgi:hypothetical protein
MSEYLSETHRAVVGDNGLLTVWPRAPRELRVTSSTPDGGLDTTFVNSENADPSHKKLLEGLNRAPLFAAGYAGSSEWNLDIDCGFQRWRGTKTSKQFSDALSKCGFDAATKKQITTTCRKHRVDYIPRFS